MKAEHGRDAGERVSWRASRLFWFDGRWVLNASTSSRRSTRSGWRTASKRNYSTKGGTHLIQEKLWAARSEEKLQSSKGCGGSGPT